MLVKPPRFYVANFRSVKYIGDEIPSTAVKGQSVYYVNDVVSGSVKSQRVYLIYNPLSDTVYGVNLSLDNSAVKYFVSSYAYKSYYFTRNNVSDIVGTDTLQSKILNSLKVWVLIALGLGVAFLVVRFGPQIMIRLFLPFAVLGALGRIGRSNKDE